MNEAFIVNAYERFGVHLKRKGRRWVALCPFHIERTPSFTVFPDDGSYKCFGCGVHGTIRDVIDAEGEDETMLLRIDVESVRDKSDSQMLSFMNLLETRLLNRSKRWSYVDKSKAFDRFDQMRIRLRYDDREGLIGRIVDVKKEYKSIVDLGGRDG